MVGALTTDELGLSPWNPFTWLLTLEFIASGAGGETDV
jgi:hypothetical protein